MQNMAATYLPFICTKGSELELLLWFGTVKETYGKKQTAVNEIQCKGWKIQPARSKPVNLGWRGLRHKGSWAGER